LTLSECLCSSGIDSFDEVKYYLATFSKINKYPLT